MRRVDQQLEEGLSKSLVRSLDHGPTALDIRECFKLTRPQKLDVPVFDARTLKASLVVNSEVDLHILRNR